MSFHFYCAVYRFQFLGRNSGRSDNDPASSFANSCMFQFLGRNSGRSDPPAGLSVADLARQFQFLGRNSGRSDASNRPGSAAGSRSFNSSVGILVVRTGLI